MNTTTPDILTHCPPPQYAASSGPTITADVLEDALVQALQESVKTRASARPVGRLSPNGGRTDNGIPGDVAAASYVEINLDLPERIEFSVGGTDFLATSPSVLTIAGCKPIIQYDVEVR